MKPGRELDKAVAEKIMGWRWISVPASVGILAYIQRLPWAATAVLVLFAIALAGVVVLAKEAWEDRRTRRRLTDIISDDVLFEVQWCFPGHPIKDDVVLPHYLCKKCGEIARMWSNEIRCSDKDCGWSMSCSQYEDNLIQRAKDAARVARKKGLLRKWRKDDKPITV